MLRNNRNGHNVRYPSTSLWRIGWSPLCHREKSTGPTSGPAQSERWPKEESCIMVNFEFFWNCEDHYQSLCALCHMTSNLWPHGRAPASPHSSCLVWNEFWGCCRWNPPGRRSRWWPSARSLPTREQGKKRGNLLEWLFPGHYNYILPDFCWLYAFFLYKRSAFLLAGYIRDLLWENRPLVNVVPKISYWYQRALLVYWVTRRRVIAVNVHSLQVPEIAIMNKNVKWSSSSGFEPFYVKLITPSVYFEI